MYVALTGMRMSQAAMEVASHNLANVNTPGYSRQRINLATLTTVNSSWGQMGLGVDANNIQRYHDEFLTRSLITTSSTLGRNVALKSSLDNLELFFNESAGNGVNQAMNDFFASWDQLADEPSSEPYREELLETASTLTKQLAMRRDDLDALRVDANERLADSISEINNLVNEIAALNREITVYEDPVLNRQANDLRDTRDELTRQLAEHMNIDFYEDPHDGQLTITSSTGIPLVLKDRAFELTAYTRSNGDVEIRTSHYDHWMEDISGSITEGAVGGWLTFRDDILADYYRQYDSFVDGLIFNLNDQHAQGAGETMFSDVTATSTVSNLAATVVSFPGDDNDLRLTSLVPHLPSKEPYDGYDDPENIEIRFEKAKKATSEITSSVTFNDDPARMKWEIVITLPTDSNGNVSVSARELADYINSERSPSPVNGVNYLPPRTAGWKVGDFIGAEGVADQSDRGAISFQGPTFPPQAGEFLTLDRSLQYALPQGQHLSHGLDYAELKTSFKHVDNDVLFVAVEKGAGGEAIGVEYWSDGTPGQSLAVEVVQSQDGVRNIRVRLATDAEGRTITTAGEVVAAVNAHVVARTLVTAATPEGETGLGLVSEMDKTMLDRSGFFTLAVYGQDGEAEFHRVTVNPEDTLQDVLSQIGSTFDEGIPGLRVEALTDRHGRDAIRLIAAEGVEFGYAGDCSGALAALGLNTLFTGDDGSDVGVNPLLAADRSRLNAARINSNGEVTAGDNSNALAMADVKDRRFAFYHQPSATLGAEFNSIYADIGASVQAATRDYDFSQGIYSQLENRQDSIAGVNLDEELADILRFQYMYQAAAKMISTIDTMMETLLAMR
jgi:flagellar hook-associated protein FlgK